MEELTKRDPRSNEGERGKGTRRLSKPLSHGNSKAKREVGGQEAVANARVIGFTCPSNQNAATELGKGGEEGEECAWAAKTLFAKSRKRNFQA